MKVQIKYRGQVLKTHIPNPTIGQFVTLTAGDTRIRLYWDGKRFVLPQAHVVDAAQIVAAAVEEAQEDVDRATCPTGCMRAATRASSCCGRSRGRTTPSSRSCAAQAHGSRPC